MNQDGYQFAFTPRGEMEEAGVVLLRMCLMDALSQSCRTFCWTRSRIDSNVIILCLWTTAEVSDSGKIVGEWHESTVFSYWSLGDLVPSLPFPVAVGKQGNIIATTDTGTEPIELRYRCIDNAVVFTIVGDLDRKRDLLRFFDEMPEAAAFYPEPETASSATLKRFVQRIYGLVRRR